MRISTRFWNPERTLGAALVVLALAVLPARAGASTPRDIVQQTSDQVVAVLADKALSNDERKKRVEDIVLRNVDFPTLSRLVLARNWSRFSPAQQEEFLKEFQAHLAATYGRRLDDYRNETVSITGERQEANGDWTVKSKILRGEGGQNDIVVDYRLRQADGQWKIIDFIIEQVSLVANFRAQFQDMVAKGGPEQVLKVLREKTAKGETIAS